MNRCTFVSILILLGILLLSFAPISVTTGSYLVSLIKGAKPTEQVKAFPPLPPHSPPSGWPQEGMTGTYDRASLQRGFQVYKQVCSVCHSMKLLSYRNLRDLGFSEPEVKALAAGNRA